MTQPQVEILRLDEVDSTNAEARRLAEAGRLAPVWITARRQTAGRGRRGRAWSSETGNLATTLLAVTRRPPAEAAQVTFVAALAAHELIAAFVEPERVHIKWPNDVLIDGRKACGILLESGAHPSGVLWLAVGIGVNLAHAPDDVERPATSVAATLRSDLAYAPSPEVALDVLAHAFDAWWERWERYGFDPIRAAWTNRAQGLGGPAVARLGHETVEGVAEGLAEDGALRLRLADGSIRSISAGDVFFGEGG
jgi:BirA family transcriptional regulator, biotin operon repressor / biotin---[acetyl-CoA-carboxylase] ligase